MFSVLFAINLHAILFEVKLATINVIVFEISFFSANLRPSIRIVVVMRA